MKTRIVSILTALGVVGAGCSGISEQKVGQNPNYHDNCIDFPGTPVPQPQLGKIIQRLQKDTKYPENYRVAVWDKGKQTRSIGQMKIDKADVSKIDANAKSSGLTALTYRVGQCRTGLVCDPKCTGGLRDSKQLVEEVTKILKNY
jgi:hypothetical protein